ncbi:hypothetical protein TNCV_1676631 [Trichonephila clavipes]|nr:hypothetical protein TNCV_1676631 [Trichonephila clavipes]
MCMVVIHYQERKLLSGIDVPEKAGKIKDDYRSGRPQTFCSAENIEKSCYWSREMVDCGSYKKHEIIGNLEISRIFTQTEVLPRSIKMEGRKRGVLRYPEHSLCNWNLSLKDALQTKNSM